MEASEAGLSLLATPAQVELAFPFEDQLGAPPCGFTSSGDQWLNVATSHL
jgi:hypothetical protein